MAQRIGHAKQGNSPPPRATVTVGPTFNWFDLAPRPGFIRPVANGRIGNRRDVEKLIIGIDFGTTYTGIAYAFTSVQNPIPEEILVIKEWKGKFAKGRNDFLKVPSLIKYDSPDSDEYTWGYHINPAEVLFHRTSMAKAGNHLPHRGYLFASQNSNALSSD